MSMIDLKELAQLTGVAAGQRATLGVPVGPISYDHLALELTGVTKAQIKNIRVEIGGKTVQTYKDATRLETLSKYYKYQVDDDRLVIPFYREHLQIAAEAQAFTFGAADVGIFQVSWDIDAAAANPSIKAYAAVGPSMALGFITKVKEFSAAASAAGTLEIDNIPRSAWIQAIHLKSPHITAVELEANSKIHWKGDKTRMSKYLQRAGRVPQTDFYHIDFMTKNVMGTQMVAEGLQDLRLRLEMADAAQVDVIVEYYDGFQGI